VVGWEFTISPADYKGNISCTSRFIAIRGTQIRVLKLSGSLLVSVYTGSGKSPSRPAPIDFVVVVVVVILYDSVISTSIVQCK